MYTTDVETKIPPTRGCGIQFAKDGQLLTTESERSKHSLRIGVDVSTWLGSCAEAVHFYATMYMPGVYFYDPVYGGMLSSNYQPEESRDKKFDVGYITDVDMYSESSWAGGKTCFAHAGEVSVKFETIEKLIEVVESEFERIFGDPWVLVQSHTDRTWLDYKKELLIQYAGWGIK